MAGAAGTGARGEGGLTHHALTLRPKRTAMPQSFSQTYPEARARFIEAATAAGFVLQAHEHPLRGQDNEALAMDVARGGAEDPSAMLLLTSACHGVEGFCGSGLQTALLSDRSFIDAAQRAGVALLFVHALNPWGFAWWRRTTHENIDLNRNWHDFSQPLPHNRAYDEIADLLLPPTWPPSAEVSEALSAYGLHHGAMALQTAISAGQYRHPDGLFYGGTTACWSQISLRQVLREHAARSRRLAWIDVHTGLGPNGHGERIFADRHDAAVLQRARRWWGAEVTSTVEGTSASAPLNGLMFNAVYDECPQAEYTGIALEFGTVPMDEMLAALREDQWCEIHRQTSPTLRQAARRRMRDVFYIDSDGWKQRVLAQGRQAAQQALAGLSGAR
jgi:hypothetical protein